MVYNYGESLHLICSYAEGRVVHQLEITLATAKEDITNGGWKLI